MNNSSSDRTFPTFTLPSAIEAEILKAKEKFKSKYGIDPASGQAALDEEFDYPVNWWDLMNHELYREWQTLEGEHQDVCACLSMEWQREDYYNSPEGKWELEQQKRVKEDIDKGMEKLKAYTGRESMLRADLYIPSEGEQEGNFRGEVILLASKFGYECPFSAAELIGSGQYTSIDKSHKAFKKYEQDICEDWINIEELMEWEYEDAMKYLQSFVPKGYFLDSVEDVGWGVFREGAFDGPEY